MALKKHTRRLLFASSAAGALLLGLVSGNVAQNSGPNALGSDRDAVIMQLVEEPDNETAAVGSAEVAEDQIPKSVLGLIATVFAGIIGSVVGMVGIDRVMRIFERFGNWIGGSAKKAADATVKTTKTTLKKAARTGRQILHRPLKWIGVTFCLTVFMFTGIGLLDLELQVGLITGIGLTGLAVFGYRRMKGVVKNALKKGENNNASHNTADA